MTDNDVVFTVVISCLLLLLLVAALIIVFFVWNRQRSKQEIKMAAERLQFEQELRKVESEVSEHIMGQFARELHDNIGQLLTSIHIQVQNQKMENPQLAAGFKPVEIYLAEVIQQLRLLSRTLNNDFIGYVGLFASLETEVNRIRALNRFTIHPPQLNGHSYLGREQELMVFRIFQEVMQNALKHSGAQNVYVSAEADENTFVLRVSDDGKGFERQEVLKAGKVSGLQNMIKRARLAGMELHIDSSAGKGCNIELRKIGLAENKTP